MFIACTQEESVEINDNSTSISFGEIRSQEEAVEIAQSSMSMLDDNGIGTRAGGRHIDKNKIKVIATQGTRSTLPDTLMYVINFADKEGYAVVSANRATEGLLAITEKGEFGDELYEENEGLQMFMDAAKVYVQESDGERALSRAVTPGGHQQIKYVNDTINRRVIGPKVQVRWGQKWPEGFYCPNHIAGCANTASAMAMSYYEYPTTISLTYSGRDANSQDLVWDDIKKHVQGSENNYCISCNATAYEHSAIGKLCRQLGHMSSSSYLSNKTNTYLSNIWLTLINLGYNVSPVSNYHSMDVYNNISDCIMMMSGQNSVGTGDSLTIKHMWIADGVRYYEVMHREYVKNDRGMWVLNYEAGPAKTLYNHYNWGFYGNSNGYFSDNVFALSSVVYSDNGTHASQSNHNYSVNVQYFKLWHN